MLADRTLQDGFYKIIKKLIVDLKIKPGERIKIEDLTVKLGVSRTPIREVLQRLKTEDLVRFIPRIGPVAKEVSQKEIEDLFTIRLRLETLAAEQAIESITEKDIIQLKGIIKKTNELVKKGDAKAVGRLNRRFHQEIYKKSNNLQLQKFLEDIFTKIERYMNILSHEDKFIIYTHKDHEMIFNTIKDKNLVAMRKCIEKHLDLTKERFIRILKDKYNDGFVN